MLILKDEENKYIVKLSSAEVERLKVMAEYWYKGSCEKMLHDCIFDGLDVAESLHKLHEDTEYREDCLRKLCTTEHSFDNKG